VLAPVKIEAVGFDPPARTGPIRILLVEDHLVVVDALEALLNDQPDMVVVGKSGSVADSAQRAIELLPDVVILDFRLNDGTGADAAMAISKAGCRADMIFLTRDESDATRLAAIEAGASAVLYKSKASSELIGAVRTVADGGTLIPSAAIPALVDRRRRVDGQRDRLTSREREVLNLVAKGMPSREIAATLSISYLTVRTHLHNLGGKLASHSKLELIVKARELALID